MSASHRESKSVKGRSVLSLGIVCMVRNTKACNINVILTKTDDETNPIVVPAVQFRIEA